MYFIDKATFAFLVEQFMIVCANSRNAEGLRVFVKQEPDKAFPIIATALAEYMGKDVMFRDGNGSK